GGGGAGPGVEDAEGPRPETGRDHPASALLDVVRLVGNARQPEKPPVRGVDAERAALTARVVNALPFEGEVLGGRGRGAQSQGPPGAGRVERPLVHGSGADPSVTAAGREADVVREERRPEPPEEPSPPRWVKIRHTQ